LVDSKRRSAPPSRAAFSFFASINADQKQRADLKKTAQSPSKNAHVF
jgi:hypothetical protein